MTATWVDLPVPGETMRAYVTRPDGAGAHPAVVVIQHAGGVDSFVRIMTGRIAEAGFVGIAPDLYHRDDPASADDPLTRMSRLRDNNVLDDVDAAIACLRGDRGVRWDSIGITGFCMGGRVAYLVAGARPSDVKASVVFYGGNIFVPWGQGPRPFDYTKDIACPVLGLFGADDGNPNQADVAKIDAELTRLGQAHEFHSYPGAGHAFMSEGRPSYREDAARDAWQRCVAFFREHLGG